MSSLSFSFRKILICGIISAQFIIFSGTTWANTENFLITLENGFYSNAIPSDTGGIGVTGSGGTIFKQNGIGSITGKTSGIISGNKLNSGSIINNTSGVSGAPLPENITPTVNVLSSISPPTPIEIKSNKPSKRILTLNKKRKVTTAPDQTLNTSTNKSQVQVVLNSIDNNINLTSGMIVTKKSSKDFSNINGIIQWGNIGTRYLVIITSDKHDYFIRVPIEADGTWSTENTTTPQKILENFLTSGRIKLKISVIELGRNIPISNINQEIFVVSESLLIRGR